MSTPYNTWQLLILGVLVILLLFWFTPGLKQAFKMSQEAKSRDWLGALIPLGIVVAFVILLLYIV
jgi:accessory gene regulator protein AgrB